MESNANEEMYEKGTRECFIAVGIGILLGIAAYVVAWVAWFVNPHLLKPGRDPVLAAIGVGGAGLFLIGFSFIPVYIIIELVKGNDFEELDLYGKVLYVSIMMGFAMSCSSFFVTGI